MNVNYHAKIEHYETLASRAAYNAAVSVSEHDRAAWEERAARYDEQAASYRSLARKAA